MKPAEKSSEKAADRIAALQSALTTVIRGGQTPGPTPKAEEVLPIVGDLLRRKAVLGTDLGVADKALSALSPTEVSKYLEAVDVGDLKAQLERAADEAMEAGLAEAADEQELWSASALDALFARDRAESVRVALERYPQAGAMAAKLTAALAELDRALTAKARRLTPLNPIRRTERDLLDPEHRASAWWFTARSECDELLRMLAGEVTPTGEQHLKTCPDCQRDLARARKVEEPRERHITRDEAWRFELGELTADERRRLKTHAEGCLDCAQLFWAMDEGDKAIAELEAGTADYASAPEARPFSPAAPSPGGATRPQRSHREVARREAYRVVLIRGPRLRVLVQPQRSLAMAVMSVPPQRNVYEPKSTQEGLEFDLGEADYLKGRTARLTVRVSEHGENEVVEVPL